MVPNPEIVLAGFRESIDAIEEAYEFMLAYAAQGRLDEDSTNSPNIRELAEKAKAALEKFSQKMKVFFYKFDLTYSIFIVVSMYLVIVKKYCFLYLVNFLHRPSFLWQSMHCLQLQ